MAVPKPLLALPSELAAKTGRPAGDLRLNASILEASRRFRSAVHHDVSLSAAPEEIELEGSGATFLLLPRFPVVAVTAVTSDDVVLPVDGTVFRAIRPTGMLKRTDGRVWPLDRLIEVTYTAGYDCTVQAVIPPDGDTPAVPELIPGLPDDIQGAVLSMAEVLINEIAGVQSRTVLQDTVSFGSKATVGETQAWSDAVMNYQLRGGA